jgi:uncharacterized protein
MSEVNAFHIMTKPRGAICNLDCAYCYFLKKESLYPKSNFRMSDDVLENFTRQYIQAQRLPRVTFAWQGGEPTLMGLDFFKKAIEYQKLYAPQGMEVENTFQTNGTLLDDDWGDFFKENHFLIGISVDGPPEIHNVYRKDKGGAPTFLKVLSGLEILKNHDVDFNILATVHAANADHPLEVYRFFRDELEAKFIQFIPIVERDNKKGEQKGNKVTDRSVTGKQYGDFLIKIFDEWVSKDVGEIFVQIFDVALGNWLGQPGGLCVFSETCGLALALEHNGDLYSCDHYVEPRYRLGNIGKSDLSQLINSHKQLRFGRDKRDTLPKFCLNCEVRFACHGGCPKNRILHTPSGEYGLNYLCEGYRSFFNHIDEAMNIMADLLRAGKTAKEVMDIYQKHR